MEILTLKCRSFMLPDSGILIKSNGDYVIVRGFDNIDNEIQSQKYNYYIENFIWNIENIIYSYALRGMIDVRSIKNSAVLKTIYQLLLEGYIEMWHYNIQA